MPRDLFCLINGFIFVTYFVKFYLNCEISILTEYYLKLLLRILIKVENQIGFLLQLVMRSRVGSAFTIWP